MIDEKVEALMAEARTHAEGRMAAFRIERQGRWVEVTASRLDAAQLTTAYRDLVPIEHLFRQRGDQLLKLSVEAIDHRFKPRPLAGRQGRITIDEWSAAGLL